MTVTTAQMSFVIIHTVNTLKMFSSFTRSTNHIIIMINTWIWIFL